MQGSAGCRVVQGAGCRVVQGAELQGAGCRVVQSTGCRVQGAGCMRMCVKVVPNAICQLISHCTATVSSRCSCIIPCDSGCLL